MKSRDDREAAARLHALWLLQLTVYADMLEVDGNPDAAEHLTALAEDVSEIVIREVGRRRFDAATASIAEKVWGPDWKTRPDDAPLPPGRLH